MRFTYNAPLVAATAVREADENFQDHILEASIAPPIKLTATRNEHNPSVQSRKRLPLKMIISELASRDTNTVETEPAHQSIPSHIDNVSMCTAPITKRCPGRCFLKKSLADPADDAMSHCEHTFFSENFQGPGNEVASLASHFSKADERCSRCANMKKVFPHGYYSTPRAKARFHCLYGNEVLNKTVKSEGLTGLQTCQNERGQWLNNDDEVPYIEKYKERKKFDHQSQSSAMSKRSNVDTRHEYDTEDANDNVSLQKYPLDSPKNIGSHIFIKHVHEKNDATNVVCSPLSSTYSSVNTYSDGSTEEEHEQANYKRKHDYEYTSENRFLHPLVKYKSRHQKAENVMTDVLYAMKSRNVSDWKRDCKNDVDDFECISPNADERYSPENLSATCTNCDSGTVHNAVVSSADPICWYQVKYTRRTQRIRISTKLSGLPESKQTDQIPTYLQQTGCSPPSDWDSLSQNHGLNIVPYLSSPEDESHEKPTSEDLVFTHK